MCNEYEIGYYDKKLNKIVAHDKDGDVHFKLININDNFAIENYENMIMYYYCIPSIGYDTLNDF